MNSKIVILDNIRSAHNVGSIFRTSDGAGVEKIYLVGRTPVPLDRFGREVGEIKKTSLGASEFVLWEQVGDEDAPALTLRLKEEGYEIVAVEQVADSKDFNGLKMPNKVAYIFGNEIDGVGEELLKAADQVVHIPMQGKKESLNVSVAAGIILFKNNL